MISVLSVIFHESEFYLKNSLAFLNVVKIPDFIINEIRILSLGAAAFTTDWPYI